MKFFHFAAVIAALALIASVDGELIEGRAFSDCDPLVHDCFAADSRIDDEELAGRVMLITRASRWIGPDLAQYFVRLGVRVVLFDETAAAEQLQDVAAALGGEQHALWLSGDGDCEQEQARVFAAAQRHFGAPVSCVLINTERADYESPAAALDELDARWRDVRAAQITVQQVAATGRPATAVFLSSIASLTNLVDRRQLAASAAFLDGYLPAMAAFNSLAQSASQRLNDVVDVYLLLPAAYQPAVSSPADRWAALSRRENPVFPQAAGAPDQLAQIVEHLLRRDHAHQPGAAILTDHDATFSGVLWAESHELGYRHALFEDQVGDASGKHRFDFTKRRSAAVKKGSSADKTLEILQRVLLS